MRILASRRLHIAWNGVEAVGVFRLDEDWMLSRTLLHVRQDDHEAAGCGHCGGIDVE